ncbi:hypothetical protein GWI33_013861 [Rhynchophorus ferrugineus]|uniref:Uncharacterized protein n=1 Tax=Rhynchophorus ferrugineus TaxID=354439 RepID=A0A834IG79_RHYFE|nr:hypothetical protein GWI33_013861 [Rhynchophorus ferrugineus]
MGEPTAPYYKPPLPATRLHAGAKCEECKRALFDREQLDRARIECLAVIGRKKQKADGKKMVKFGNNTRVNLNLGQ